MAEPTPGRKLEKTIIIDGKDYYAILGTIFQFKSMSLFKPEEESPTMSRTNNSIRPSHSDKDLARMVVGVAEATHVDGIICITETGVLAQHLYRMSGRFRVIATTTNSETYDTLAKAGMEVIRLPLHTADKYTQIRHAITVVLQSSSVSTGDLVVCAIGRDVYPDSEHDTLLPPQSRCAPLQQRSLSQPPMVTYGRFQVAR